MGEDVALVEVEEIVPGFVVEIVDVMLWAVVEDLEEDEDAIVELELLEVVPLVEELLVDKITEEV